jgi:uncharacterized protein DUF3426
MFINCPYCKALVATDPATDLPPEQCPRCAAKLRGVAPNPPVVAVTPARSDDGSVPPFGNLLELPAQVASPAGDSPPPAPPSELSSQIHRIVAGEAPAEITLAPAVGIASIATLLKPATIATPPSAPPVLEPPAERNANEAAPTATAEAPAHRDDVDAGASQLAEGTPQTAGRSADTQAVEAGPAVQDDPQGTPETPANKTIDSVTVKAMPSFARTGTTFRRKGFHWKISATIAALALLLLLQLLLADRAQLAADARWRPLVSGLCQAFGCALPPWREPTAFAVLARDVRPHPSAAGALRVTATFRNDARWPQPWPRLRLTLSDVDGNPVAAREFSARDYLGAAPASAEIARGQSASIAMDIVEPGPRSVAFDFQLH